MIKNSKSLSIAELKGILKDVTETEQIKNLEVFSSKFTKLKPEEAIKLREELEAKGMVKLNDSSITKIIDTLPKDSEDVRKIFSDTSISESEINEILEIVKSYS